ncbi:hypothetical protein BDU57DRAFT_541932 [Ampelomyces quisqualis]|uniref:DUF6697 domain-containing protein n=1 Tax=Ampelomyces quisqualis TaxID=50730 RepID=A0A6A5QGV8_AMPQU|nr:hypothetical protein BDU57DRAFT_541932 [Ampelomyces quisqualis]
MTDRDPSITFRLHNVNPRLNPAAPIYAPGPQSQNMPSQASAPPSPYLEARVSSLEEEHSNLREDVSNLTELYHNLCSSVDKLKKGHSSVTVGPSQEQGPARSHQSALKFKQELEELSREVHKSVEGVTDVDKTDGTAMSKTNGSMPPHLRGVNGASNGTGSKSLPPHLRGNNTNGTQEQLSVASLNGRLATDGPMDTITGAAVPAPEPSPPPSPATIVQQDRAIKKLSLNSWKPYYLTTLSPVSLDFEIPRDTQMTTFHPQFLEDHLAGADWSPGMKYVKGNGTCILKNRTYFMLSSETEPYLPEQPGEHCAKLTAFFNKAPEEVFGDLPDGATTYDDVPVFVEHKDSNDRPRYTYYGNYSQTRWSDRLDYDAMMTRVPQHIKEYWATELTSPLRPDWLTEELKKHFFKKPEYEGKITAAPEIDTPTEITVDEIKCNDRMAKEVRIYVEELREWEREAKMKTSMIKKQFILDSFNAADCDDPPALRLWWEYLECVDWRKDFYDLLVTLQSREAKYLK